MRNFLARFMMGRNGIDRYSLFLSYAACILFLISLLMSRLAGQRIGSFLYALALALFIYAYYRAFSRKLDKRRAENQKYLQKSERVRSWLRVRKERFRQRKDYCFFKCPACKTVLRVPRGKGRVRVICRKCGQAFERKT